MPNKLLSLVLLIVVASQVLQAKKNGGSWVGDVAKGVATDYITDVAIEYAKKDLAKGKDSKIMKVGNAAMDKALEYLSDDATQENFATEEVTENMANCITYTVTAAQLNVRNGPEGSIIGRVNRGQTVCVFDRYEKWAKTEYGWMSGKYLSKVRSNEEDIIFVSGRNGEMGRYETYLIKGNGEQCEAIVLNKDRIIDGTCLSLVNSKGVKIICTQNKKICKTEKEILNFSDMTKGKNRINKLSTPKQNISYPDSQSPAIINFYHPKSEPKQLYIVDFKYENRTKKYRVYCPTGMVRDISNGKWKKAREAYSEDKIKYGNKRIIRQVFDEICN